MKSHNTHPPVFYLFLFLFSFVLLSISPTIFASDLEKEKRWAEQISDSLLDGEAISLNDGKVDFLAIDTQADEAKDVAVIVIHGIGIHPDWPLVIQPLRVRLAEQGWNTLSLQMPILANDATIEDYKPLFKEVPGRIDAGIRYLTKAGAKKIVIIAHSLGSLMSSYYLAEKKNESNKEDKTESKAPIIAFIGIGMGSATSQYLKKINLPILDLYGEKDLPDVVKSAASRKEATKNNSHYQQVKVAGANHFFEDQDDDLLKAVTNALAKY